MTTSHYTHITYAGGTDRGRVRQQNEDSYLCHQFANTDVSLMIVADGVGGYAGGAEASQLAVKTMQACVEKYILLAHSGAGYAENWLELTLKQAVSEANQAILKFQQTHIEYAEMATTMVAVLVKGNELALCHLGDSRCYQFTDGTLIQITEDHTYLQDMLNAGKIDQQEFELLPMHHVISQALGLFDSPDINVTSLLLVENISYLLCSDGLTNFVSDAQIQHILTGVSSLQACVDELITNANDNGGADNITVVLLTYSP